ncbi:MAG: subclass B3 metallo-beta-lactamase [Sphingomonas sp.]|nr:subclass B3 metallo-beta-lactamase [Sphingomonas sp.]
MFARALAQVATALALTACVTQIPVQSTPRQVDRPRAPIATAGPAFAATCSDWDDWDKPAPPVGVHGNTYHVGTCGIAAILITGDEGHVLIDTGTEAGASVVAANIRRLGFDLDDVKIILNSHEHFDHVGGMAKMKALTGADLYASSEASKVFQSGVVRPTDPQSGMHAPMALVSVNRIIEDGDVIRLGDIEITAIATPGHSPGAMSWRWGACEAATCHRIVYADSLSPASRDEYRFSDNPPYLAAYRAGLDRIAEAPCNFLLTPHPSASDMVDRFAGRAPLVDEAACVDYADGVRTRVDERLARESE